MDSKAPEDQKQVVPPTREWKASEAATPLSGPSTRSRSEAIQAPPQSHPESQQGQLREGIGKEQEKEGIVGPADGGKTIGTQYVVSPGMSLEEAFAAATTQYPNIELAFLHLMRVHSLPLEVLESFVQGEF